MKFLGSIIFYLILCLFINNSYASQASDKKYTLRQEVVDKEKNQDKNSEDEVILIAEPESLNFNDRPLSGVDYYINGALTSSPDVQERIFNKEESENLVKKSRNSLFPTITASAGLGSQYNRSASANSSTRFDAQELSLGLHQNIFGEGKLTDLKFNKSILNSKKEELAQMKNFIILSTIESYLDILRYRKIINIQTKSIESHEDVLKKTKSRLDAGLARASDLSLAEGRLALARSNLSLTESKLQKAYNSLYRYSGLEVRGVFSEINFPDNLPVNFDEAWSVALSGNPILKAKYHEISTVKYAKKKDLLKLYPSLSFDASSGKTYDTDGTQGIDKELSAMLNLKYVFNFGGNIYKNKASASRVEVKRREYKKSVSDVRQNLSNLYSDYDILSKRMVFVERNRDFLDDVVKKHQKEFAAGFRGLFDLLNTKSEFSGAQIEQVNLSYDLKILAFNILANTGMLLKSFNY